MIVDNPLVTIAIPAYNAEKTIGRAIGSALNQTYQELEVVVVDDGSNDATYESIMEVAGGDSRVRVLRHESNKKLFEARRSLVESAKGNYLIFLDADDELTSDCCEKCIDALRSRAVDILHFSVEPIYLGVVPEEVREGDTQYFKPEAGVAFGEDIIHRIYSQRKGPWCVWGKAFATDLVRNAYDASPTIELQYGEDGFCFFNIGRFAASYMAVPDIVGYRHHIEQGDLGAIRVNLGSLEGLRRLCSKRAAVDEIARTLDVGEIWGSFRDDYERIKQQYADDSVGYLITRIDKELQVEAFDLMMEFWSPADALETFLRRGAAEADKSIDIIRASKRAKRINVDRASAAILVPVGTSLNARFADAIKRHADWLFPIVDEGGRRTGFEGEELLTVASPDLYYFRLRRLLELIKKCDIGVICVPNQIEYPYCWDAAIASLEGCLIVDEEELIGGRLGDSARGVCQRAFEKLSAEFLR